MAALKLSSKNLLLILLYSPGVSEEPCEPVEGRTRLTKMVFLFEKEVLAAFRRDTQVDLQHLEFEAWKYGPMSKQLFADIDFLKSIGFVAVSRGSDPSAIGEESDENSEYESEAEIAQSDLDIDQYTPECFRLSKRGRQFVEERSPYPKLSENQKKALREFKKRINSATLRSILRYVYAQYPDMAKRSEIKEKTNLY